MAIGKTKQADGGEEVKRTLLRMSQDIDRARSNRDMASGALSSTLKQIQDQHGVSEGELDGEIERLERSTTDRKKALEDAVRELDRRWPDKS